MSPASGDERVYATKAGKIEEVSIQLMSPASGDAISLAASFAAPTIAVSIQLMSPASGDIKYCRLSDGEGVYGCFHSINVPSEWGLFSFSAKLQTLQSFPFN